MSKLDDWIDENPESKEAYERELAVTAVLEVLAARVAAAWQAYEYASECGGTAKTPRHLHIAYRALADELEQATGLAVTCGALTGRPA